MKPTKTAAEIATEIEQHANQMLTIVKVLRGKV